MPHFMLLIALLFAGCASYSIKLNPTLHNPAQSSHYEDGVLVLTSSMPSSKVRLELAQSKIGGASNTPLALFITAQNRGKSQILFDIEHITLSQNDTAIAPISEESLKNDAFDMGSIIEAFHLYLPPKPAPEHYVSVPLIYRGFGGFGVYDYMIISAREQMQRQIKLEEQRAKRAIIFASLLRKNTLLPSTHAPFKGGFVLYRARDLKEGSVRLRVIVGSERHDFELKLDK